MSPRLHNPDLRVLIQSLLHLVSKRRKDLLYLGSFHASDLLDFYGFAGGHVGTDSLSMYTFLPSPSPISAVDEDHASQSSSATSPVSNITWPNYTLGSKEVLLFSDNPDEEYTTIPDTYRADGIDAINELQTALGV